MPAGEAAAYLRGAADGYSLAVGQVDVDVVWSVPSSTASPVRTTVHVLTDLIRGARQELILVTYSARPYAPLTEVLTAAVARGVEVTIVVETLQGAGSALTGSEPAAAFQGVDGIHLWHWPTDLRPKPAAKMHAKLAVADRLLLFISSVNLTESGVAHSMEAGVLITGGEALALRPTTFGPCSVLASFGASLVERLASCVVSASARS